MNPFGLLLVTTMLSAQPADVPGVEPAMKPCQATHDGPQRPTIVGRSGRFDPRCIVNWSDAPRVTSQTPLKNRRTVPIFIHRRH